MILILSLSHDQSTSNVIDWLLYYNSKFIRINHQEMIDAEIHISNDYINIQFVSGKILDLSTIKKYWYRRGNFIFSDKYLKGNQAIINTINQDKLINNNDIVNYIHNYLKNNISSINSYNDNFINKLDELELASKVGLNIPFTLITSSRKSALDFINTHNKIITKSIKNSINFEIDQYSYYFNTTILNKHDIEEFPETFSPIKLQNYIEKAFELRVFFLDGKFYSSAIFSQNDEQTKIDFRNYNESNPNRVVPYSLPQELQLKLNEFMRILNLKSGSFDIVVTEEGKYVFLEVNPIGQFTQVSVPCNYYLEKEMAILLSN